MRFSLYSFPRPVGFSFTVVHHDIVLADGKVLLFSEFHFVAVDVGGGIDRFVGVGWAAIGALADIALVAAIRAFLVLTHLPKN